MLLRDGAGIRGERGRVDYRVVEIFKSIEGEGRRVGAPCVFVRLAGCNLRCSYCDTDYAQSRSDGSPMSLAEIVDKVWQLGGKRVTITGGEPLLQDAMAIASALPEFECNIETNGAVPLPTKARNAFFTMDWKCGCSGMTDLMLRDNLTRLDERDVIKFVVGSEGDMAQAKEVIESGVRATPYISPVFGEIEPREIVEYILANGLEAHVQVQLHKVIWDPSERGV